MALLILACAVEVPYDSGLVEENVLAGEVVFAGVSAPGPAAVLLFSADDPPPPLGTGGPLDFSMVPQAAFTGSDAGMQAAAWSMAGVPDGSFLLSALVDADGDFHPLLRATAGATCGDWLGAHLEDLAGTVGTVSVAGGELLDDVTILVGEEVQTERPAFTLLDGSVDQAAALATFGLGSTPVHSPVVELSGPFDGSDACDVAFWFYAPDADGDGAPDPHANPDLAAAGLYDVWPKVYLQFQDDAGDWATEAVVYPSPLLDGSATLGLPTPMTELTVVFVPAAQRTGPDGEVELVTAPDLPQGDWSVTVVSFTGQTWTLPNELPELGSSGEGWEPEEQGRALRVE